MYELFVLLFDNYRARLSYLSDRRASKLSTLPYSCDNPGHQDRFGRHISSLQKSRTIELLLPLDHSDHDRRE